LVDLLSPFPLSKYLLPFPLGALPFPLPPPPLSPPSAATLALPTPPADYPGKGYSTMLIQLASLKFYELKITGPNSLSATYGKIGSSGKIAVSNANNVIEVYESTIKSKVDKGYTINKQIK